MNKILLIDDMDSVRGAIASVLRKAGFEIVEAGDGNEGLEKANSERVDLVITDIVMPSKDGLDVIHELKQKKASLPIIAMSGGAAGVLAKDALSVAKVTADHTLTKPFENDELLEAIEKLLPAA